MALFRKQKMRGFEPLAVRDEQGVREALVASITLPLTERNRVANSAMAWAENYGPKCFERTKILILQQETALHAVDLVKLVPERGYDEAIAVQFQMLAAGTQARSEDEMLQRLVGPNLPEIVAAMYEQLRERLPTEPTDSRD